MIELALAFLEAMAGLPAAALGAALLMYAVYRMARHEILLFGSVTRDPIAKREVEQSPVFTYSFLIQNLEEVTFPGPFMINLRDRRYADEPKRQFDVNVFAGPRHITYWHVPENADHSPEQWCGQFERLSPFDTWRIEVKTQSKWVELEIDTGDVNRTIFHRLIVDLSPRNIAVDAEHPRTQVFKGTAITPGLPILISIVAAATLMYIGAVSLIDRNQALFGISEFPFRHFDWYVVAVLVSLLWLGYRRIQRPVYPIIQGYFLETCVKKGRPREKDDEADA